MTGYLPIAVRSAPSHKKTSTGAVTCPGSGSKLTRRFASPTGTPPALLLRLASSRSGRVLAHVDQPSEQLIPPLLRDEPVPPQHQRPILIVHNERHRDPTQVHDVVIPPLPVGRPYVDQPQAHPPVVIDRLLTERLPSAALLRHLRSVGACTFGRRPWMRGPEAVVTHCGTNSWTARPAAERADTSKPDQRNVIAERHWPSVDSLLCSASRPFS